MSNAPKMIRPKKEPYSLARRRPVVTTVATTSTESGGITSPTESRRLPSSTGGSTGSVGAGPTAIPSTVPVKPRRAVAGRPMPRQAVIRAGMRAKTVQEGRAGDYGGVSSSSEPSPCGSLHYHTTGGDGSDDPLNRCVIGEGSRTEDVVPDLARHPRPHGVSKHGQPPLRDDGSEFVASSRSHLIRLSLEDAVIALQELQDLMMAHTAVVTGRSGGNAQKPVKRQTHVDPFKLSQRPLDDIAEELCQQLRNLVTVYEAASAAERSIMGFDSNLSSSKDAAASLKAAGVGASADDEKEEEEEEPARGGDAAGDSEQMQNALRSTFGPLISTVKQSGNDDENAVDGTDGGRAMGDDKKFENDDLVHTQRSSPTFGSFEDTHETEQRQGSQFRLQSSMGDTAASCDAGENRQQLSVVVSGDGGGHGTRTSASCFTYPNGTTVSFPISTFGDMVDTQTSAVELTHTINDMDPETLLQYAKALESRVTERQRMEAMHQAYGF